MHFVTRLEAGERMVDLCHEFKISRKTGYKFWDRFRRLGPQGLYDDSRRPYQHPKQTRAEIQKLILDLKQSRPTWGSRKLHEWLKKRNPTIQIPCHSVIYSILDRNGLVKRRNHRRTHRSEGTHITSHTQAPNELWCADFKGQFRMGNRNYCYPLTITDHLSRYLLKCESLENTRGQPVKSVFADTFEEFGLPDAILTDNGPPFGCVGMFGLSELSLWWMRLGIQIQRIKPGHPEQNGRHERMHLTLKQATTRPAGLNLLQQQERFDEFRKDFNEQRPHEALQMRCPGELYRPSSRLYPKNLNEPEYPLHDMARKVQPCGRVVISLKKKHYFILGGAFRGQRVGLREEDTGLWRVSFLNFDLGFFDEFDRVFKPFERLQPTGV